MTTDSKKLFYDYSSPYREKFMNTLTILKFDVAKIAVLTLFSDDLSCYIQC